MFKGTNNHYAEGIEVLDLETSFCHDWNEKEYIRIAVLPKDAVGENGTISFTLVQFDKAWKCTCPQANLTLQEIDLVINALLEAKKRVQALNAPNKA